jgi:hypothetical protein
LKTASIVQVDAAKIFSRVPGKATTSSKPATKLTGRARPTGVQMSVTKIKTKRSGTKVQRSHPRARIVEGMGFNEVA